MSTVSDPATARTQRIPLTGYTDRLSARGGDSIAFKLSAIGHTPDTPARVHSWLTQCICADPNPAGPGIIERAADQWYAPTDVLVTEQPLRAGSYATTGALCLPANTRTLTLQATIWPTLLDSTLRGSTQCVLAFGALCLCIDPDHHLSCTVGAVSVRSTTPLIQRQWLRIEAQLQRDQATLHITLKMQTNAERDASTDASKSYAPSVVRTSFVPDTSQMHDLFAAGHEILIAARARDGLSVDHFNGKIEAPSITAEHTGPGARVRYAWNLSQDMHSCHIPDLDGHDAALELVNYPTRAMTGSIWTGDEMCWRHAPDQYAAIHFHDDDIVDCQWSTTFQFTIPEGMPSGVYVMRVSHGQHEDAMPFFVCAPRGSPTHRICMLVPTFTYAIYGNHARPDWQPFWQDKVRQCNGYPYNPAQYPGYGLSTYNNHTDGSGICHASHARPLMNLRPGYITFGNTQCSGLRHFQADSHLWAWLDAKQLGFDIITDRELHEEGVSSINDYDLLLTSTHPEYHTAQTLDALLAYRDNGGHLSYLGGNGFYWRIALHAEQSQVLEIRRAEAGIRAWASEPGEYYQAFDGQYGGLWRRNGRPPQALCGLGFSAQGQFNGSWYRRCNHDPELNWLFAGIDTDVLGDYGLSGGGAAGFELDRADTTLGTPVNARIVATSEKHGDDFILVPEEMLTHLTTLPGPSAQELVRADIIWFEAPGGGSVFAVGSITFCGSLPHEQFDNPVSRLLLNVVDHVLNRSTRSSR